MPLTVAETPAICTGRGSVRALETAGASCAPNTLTNEPGAVDGRNDAPLATAEMEGGALEIAGVTVTTTVAFAVSNELSPLYSAVTMLPPADSCGALTIRVAVARPFDPVSLADPRGAEPRKKVMVPCGVPPF